MQRSTEQQSSRKNDRLEKLVQQFQTAWKDAADVDLRIFLPPVGDPLRPTALDALIKADLRIRWQRRRGKPLESYVERFPELGSLDTLGPDLLLEEYRARNEFGAPPELKSYRERFPRQFPAFEPLARADVTHSRLEETPSGKPASPESPLSATLPGTVPPPVVCNKDGTTTLQMLGGYQQLQRLGQGSFAEVYQGIAPGGFPVAIKRITQPMEDDEAKRELQALKSISELRHPFLLQTHSSFLVDNHLIVVMELADGTLRDRQKACQKAGERIPLPELLRYFREAAEGLDYMHSRHLLHRDIKPQNILLLHGHAKLADFGLALVQASQRALFSATSSGTPAYMAPEVWGGKVSPHSDQYSLAFAYAEQRLGQLPFSATDIVSLMRAHVNDEPNLSALTIAEQEVLKRALEKDPSKRFPKCLDFVNALELALHDQLHLASPAMTAENNRATVDLHTGTLTPGRGGMDSVTELARTRPSWVAQGEGTRRPRMLTAFLVLALLGVGGWFAFTELRPTLTLEAPARLTLHPGEVKTVRLQLTRHRLDQPVRLSWSGLPEHCQTADVTLSGTDSIVDILLTIGPDASPETRKVTLRAATDGLEQESTIELSIEAPPAYTLPAGWMPAKDAVLKSSDGRAYYDKIDVVRDGIPVRFLLMEKTGKNDPDTFYIMEDKVWVGLYRQFAQHEAAEKPPLSRRWEQVLADFHLDKKILGDRKESQYKEEYPVLGVYAEDADRCAAWLGGKLPLPNQWDKAAGYYGEKKGKGPYDASYDPKLDLAKLGMAIDRKTPLPRGQGEKDVSPLGCRDMAGNGEEWTGATDEDWQPPEPKRSQRKALAGFVLIRGRNYAYPTPYSWEDISKSGGTYEGRNDRDSPTGFRVVIEP